MLTQECSLWKAYIGILKPTLQNHHFWPVFLHVYAIFVNLEAQFLIDLPLS